jgi:hypothetical protein
MRQQKTIITILNTLNTKITLFMVTKNSYYVRWHQNVKLALCSTNPIFDLCHYCHRDSDNQN